MGPFITLLAETYGLPEGSVKVTARVLREGGWLTTGPRGINAPDMQPIDAARLTLALMTGQPPGKVLADLEILHGLQADNAVTSDGLWSELDLTPDHTLGKVLTELFRIYRSPQLIEKHANQQIYGITMPSVSVSVDSPALGATVSIDGASLPYWDFGAEREAEKLRAFPDDFEAWMRIKQIQDRSLGWYSPSTIPGRGMRAIRTITDKEISRISEAIGASLSSEPADELGGEAG